MGVYYHLSLDLNICETFEPRIPEECFRLGSEDGKSARICLSNTIEGCLTAVPWGGLILDELFFDNNVSQLIRVYEFDEDIIKKENLITSETLYQTDKVRDAEISGEVWVINQKLKPTKTYLIQLNYFNEVLKDDVSYQNLIDYDYDDDNCNYEDLIEGAFTQITDISYIEIAESEYKEDLSLSFDILIKSGGCNYNPNNKNKINMETYLTKILNNEVFNEWTNDWEGKLNTNIIVKELIKDIKYKVYLSIKLKSRATTKRNLIKLIRMNLYSLGSVEFNED